MKELEEQGIGRPSTYAAILSVIQDKKYVEKLEGRFHPTELGKITTEELVKHFPHEMDVHLHRRDGGEARPDLRGRGELEDGAAGLLRPVQGDAGPGRAGQMRDVKREEIPTDITCEKCGKLMAIKWGKMGRFLACTGYPECKNTKDFKEVDGKIVPVEEETTDEICEKCGRPMVIKRGRFGRFLACSGYPECKTSKPLSIGVACPTCKVGYLTERRSRGGRSSSGATATPTAPSPPGTGRFPRPAPVRVAVPAAEVQQARRRLHRLPEQGMRVPPRGGRGRAGRAAQRRLRCRSRGARRRSTSVPLVRGLSLIGRGRGEGQRICEPLRHAPRTRAARALGPPRRSARPVPFLTPRARNGTMLLPSHP